MKRMDPEFFMETLLTDHATKRNMVFAVHMPQIEHEKHF